MRPREKVEHHAPTWHGKEMYYLIGLFLVLGVWGSWNASAGEWYVATGSSASDSNPGTRDRPFRSVRKALSHTKPGWILPHSRLRLLRTNCSSKRDQKDELNASAE